MGDNNTERRCICRDAFLQSKATRQERSQPWIVLKSTIALTLAIAGYTTYVYIARLCIPMILRRSGALGSRTIGIALLAVFSILLIMLMWTYAKIVFTSPGFAADHVPRSERPVFPIERYPDPIEWGQTEVSPVSPTTPISDVSTNTPPKEGTEPHKKSRRTKSVPNTPVIQKPHRTHIKNSSQPLQSPTDARPQREVAKFSADTGRAVAPLVVEPPPPVVQPTKVERSAVVQRDGQPIDFYWNSRRPHLAPVLLPEYRYCSKDEIVKPFRTHHCRACGTCVLKYDHHCPWVGQCVGARNQKFFLNFLEWCPLFCLWVFASTLALTVKANKNSEADFDPQVIITIVLGAVFGLFTVTMLVNQLRFTLLNRTTLEAIQARYMKEADLAKLTKFHPWYDASGKRRTKKRWDEEWGDTDTEGNLWWMGSYRANWEDVMGRNPLGWILPIGRSPNDGLTYERNARFDEAGIARPRKEWPPELR